MSDDYISTEKPDRALMRRLLILGGTAEARALASLATARFGARLAIAVSLAGRTQTPELWEGAIRVGGFGGSDGLANFLRNERIDFLVDATHPFAATMSAHAVAAAAITRVPLLRLERPPWTAQPGDRWVEAADAEAAARAALGLGQRIFLAFGGRELAPFAALTDKWFLVRRIDAPVQALPLRDYTLTLERGPFTVEAETALLRRHRIDAMVSKASGGTQTRAKLDAARVLGLPVVMIARPAKAPALTIASQKEAVRRIAAALFPDMAIDGQASVSA